MRFAETWNVAKIQGNWTAVIGLINNISRKIKNCQAKLCLLSSRPFTEEVWGREKERARWVRGERSVRQK